MDNCIFCRIARGDIPSATVYEDGDFRVILDMNQKMKGHMLVIPKEHYENLFELPEDLAAKAMILSKRVAHAAKEALHPQGLNLLQNNGEVAGQSVMHFHVHICPRMAGDDTFPAWGEAAISAEETEEIRESIHKEVNDEAAENPAE